jgi:hypothetical protein
VWNPKITDQDRQVKTNPPPWTPKAAAEVEKMFAEEKAGRPPPIFVNCLPEAMPSWMLVTHNAMEFLFTPGRVTILGESDGNRFTDWPMAAAIRRRRLTFHAIPSAIENDTLVVETVNVMPRLSGGQRGGGRSQQRRHEGPERIRGEPDIRTMTSRSSPQNLTVPGRRPASSSAAAGSTSEGACRAIGARLNPERRYVQLGSRPSPGQHRRAEA